MTHIYKNILLGALITIAPPLLGFGCFGLIKVQPDQEKHVLLLGDIHNYDEVIALLTRMAPAEGFSKSISLEDIWVMIRNSKISQPFPLLIELTERFFKEKNGNVAPLILRTIAESRKALEERTSKHFLIPIDPRNEISDMVTCAYEWVRDRVRAYTTLEEIEHYHGIHDTNRLFEENPPAPTTPFTDSIKRFRFSTERYNTPVSGFFMYLDRCLAHMKQIEARHEKKDSVRDLIHQQIETFTHAQELIKELMAGIAPTTPFPEAFKSLFYTCNTAALRIKQFEQCEKLFLHDTDYLYANVCFLDKSLDELERSPNIALIIGLSHAKPLLEMFKKLNAEVVVYDSIPHDERALYETCSKSHDYDSKLALAISTFIAAQEKAQERSVPQHQCLNCFKVGTLLACSRCKAAFYCCTACQKKDWPEHKKVCKACK